MNEKEERAGPSETLILCRIDTEMKRKNLTNSRKNENITFTGNGGGAATVNGVCVANGNGGVCANEDNVNAIDASGSNEVAMDGNEVRKTRRREENDVNDPKKRRINDADVRYTPEHSGECLVLVDTSEADGVNNKKIRNGLYFISKIKDLKSDEFQKIKKVVAIGVTLYKLTFDDWESANKFIDNDELRKRKLRPFVPRNFIETFGVIRDVPLCYSEEEIMANSTAGKKITSVRRFTRRDANDPTVFHPTETVKVGFAGDDHPQWIIFERTVLTVRTFYPAVRQCFNCGRLGHTKQGCRSRKRCIKCGSNEATCGGACEEKRCILCNGNGHVAKDRDVCPIWLKEVETNKIMTRKKMSKKEVFDMYKNQNRFDLLADDDQFPEIMGNRRTNKATNGCEDSREREVNEILTPYTFNSVVKRQRKPYIHRPGAEMHPRMFGESQPATPVYMTDAVRTSELEKVTKEMLIFMMDFLRMTGNSMAVDAMNHFATRLSKFGVNTNVPVSNMSSLTSSHGKDTTI